MTGLNGLDVVITPARECDESFVLDSWRQSYRRAPGVEGLPRAVYEKRQTRVMLRLLGHSDVKVARPADWTEGILGWVCGEHCGEVLVVHYGFVKSAYRKRGVGRSLVESFGEADRKVFTMLRPPYTDHLRNLGFTHAPHYAGVKFGRGNYG